MFKLINNFYFNKNHITKIEDGGIDPKDGKNYCKIFTTLLEDRSPIIIEGTLEEVVEYLNK
jgi:hypothetical protein